MNISQPLWIVTLLFSAVTEVARGETPTSDQSGKDLQPLIVAHRGASHDAPENTLPAFELAWEKGADAVEGDFFLTKDGKIVCAHDRMTKRLNKEEINLDVSKSTLAQLQKLDVGSWKGDQWKGTRMPTLSQVFRTVPEGKGIFIEVKCGVEIMPALKKAIEDCSLGKEQITIISFQKSVIAKAKIEMPEIKAHWLLAFSKDKKTGETKPSHKSALETLTLIKADGLDVGDNPLLTESFLKQVRANGLETHCWTVNDPKRARELAAMGVLSITTDRPALIRQALAK